MATVLSEPIISAEPGMPPLVLHVDPMFELTDDLLLQLSVQNEHLRMERNADGGLVIMPQTGGATGNRNASITAQLYIWAEKDGTGKSFDSSTGFRLPNGAIRGPDAAWVLNSRLNNLTAQQFEKYPPLNPDFVIELQSPSDRLSDLLEKMQEYIDNGVRLGLLIVPKQRQVYVFRPGHEAEVLDSPSQVSCDPELPGFTLDLTKVM